MGNSKITAGENAAMNLQILLVASCYGNRDKLRPDGPPGLYTDFPTFRKHMLCAGA